MGRKGENISGFGEWLKRAFGGGSRRGGDTGGSARESGAGSELRRYWQEADRKEEEARAQERAREAAEAQRYRVHFAQDRESERTAGARSVRELNQDIERYGVRQIAEKIRDEWANNRYGIVVKMGKVELPDVRINDISVGPEEEARDRSVVGYTLEYDYRNVVESHWYQGADEYSPGGSMDSFGPEYTASKYLFIGVGYKFLKAPRGAPLKKAILVEGNEGDDGEEYYLHNKMDVDGYEFSNDGSGVGSITDSTVKQAGQKIYDMARKMSPEKVVAAAQDRIRRSKGRR